MAKKTQDERFDDIAKGQLARVVHTELSEIVYRRETEIITGLVIDFGSNRLTNEKMLGGIARIAELRKVLGDLESQIKRGLQSSSEEFAQAQNGYSTEE